MAAATIGSYELGEILGEGGMATVYEARDPRFDRRVAVKVLDAKLARDPEIQARFRSEAVIQAKLAHPHIVTVHDFVAEGETLAIVLEYVEGTTLEELVAAAAGPLALDEALEIARQVIPAIGWAHSQGLVHRDLKPSNILIQRLGSQLFARVMDFGIAKILGAEKLRTATTAKMGTLAYMSPEHVQSPRNVDRRSDVYSLGVILYEMLSGRLPFDAETEYGLMRQIVEKPPRELPPSVRERAPGLAPVVERALAKRREDRYQSCDDLLAALETARSSSGSVAAAPASGPASPAAERAAANVPPSRLPQGNDGARTSLSPWALGGGAALALLAVLGLGMHLVSGSGGSGSEEAERELGREQGAAAAPPSEDRDPGPPERDDASTAVSDPAASAAPPSPPPSAPRPATLVVRSNVAGDSVRIDGRGYGSTPVEAELPAGRYLVEVTHPACEEHHEWIELGEGASQRLVASLTCPELEARKRLVRALADGDVGAVERAAGGLWKLLGPGAVGDRDLRQAGRWLAEREEERRREAELEQRRRGEGLRSRLESAISAEDEERVKTALADLRGVLGGDAPDDETVRRAEEWLEAQAVPAGTVRDSATGLLWTARDNGENIDWHDAERYCERLTLGGITDWRLPTIDELEGLYDESASDDCTTEWFRERGDTLTCHPRLGIDLTGTGVWSSTKQGSSRAWLFNFLYGLRNDILMGNDVTKRALCVRRSGA